MLLFKTNGPAGISPAKSFSRKMRITAKVIIALLLLLSLRASARDNAKMITLVKTHIHLSEAFSTIEQQTGVRFYFDKRIADSITLSDIKLEGASLKQALAACLKGRDLTYFIDRDKVFIRQLPESLHIALQKDKNADEATPPAEIRGRVVDEKGKPLENATVVVVGTKTGATTDSDGRFTLTAPDDKNLLLEVSSVGYKKKSVRVGSNRDLVVTLEQEVSELNEVVVVGYGTQKRVSVTGSLDVVGKSAIEGRPVSGMTEALQGTAPGLIIQQTSFGVGSDNHMNINIRGLGSTNNNDPLVVIDGIIGGDLDLINPDDIENISILKDAGAAAIYGSRAANGVILVTTKNGRLNETPTVSYSGIYGVQTPRITFHKVHAWENAMYKNISLANSGRPAAFTEEQIEQLKKQGDSDWDFEHILHNAPKQTHNISVTGGSAKNTYMISFGYFDQDNMLIGPETGTGYGSRRYNFRYNQTTRLGKVNLTTIFSYVKSQFLEPPTDAKQNIIAEATRAAYYGNYQDAQGNWLSNDVSSSNPKAILEQGGIKKTNNDQIMGTFRAEYTVTPDIKLTGVFGGTVKANTQFQREVYLQFPAGSFGSGRQVYDDNTKSLFTNTQFLAEYKKSFNKHDINVLLGVTNESFISEGNGVRKSKTDSTLGIPTTGTTVDAGTTDGSFNSITDTRETSLNSVLGRVQYAYDNKYFLDGNFRYDGSSNFPKKKRWGFFPSIGGKWRLSAEDFMGNYREKVGELMIRATYGLLGNQSVDPYQYISTYSTNNNIYGFNNTVVSGATRNLANSALTWEKAATFDIGVDGSLLQQKLTYSFDYFNKITSDILQGREDVPALFGSGLPTYNISKVKSWGWEASVGYHLEGKLFSHHFSFNIGDNQNKLLDLSYGVNQYIFKREEFWFLRQVGLPITVYEGYRTNGLYQTTEELTSYPKFANTNPGLGDLKFVDVNGDGVMDEKDRVVLGNPFPRYTYGFTYNVSFKGFDASVFIQGVGKRDQLIRGELLEAYHYGYSGTMYEHQTDFWTPDNTDATLPRISENGSDANSINYKIGSDIYLFNAAYARLKNLQVGYSFPLKLINRLHLQKARFYLTCQNLITISKLKILDPEFSEFDNRVNINAGANSGRSYAVPIFYGAGLQITFK